jgi:hypothetical protein
MRGKILIIFVILIGSNILNGIVCGHLNSSLNIPNTGIPITIIADIHEENQIIIITNNDIVNDNTKNVTFHGTVNQTADPLYTTEILLLGEVRNRTSGEIINFSIDIVPSNIILEGLDNENFTITIFVPHTVENNSVYNVDVQIELISVDHPIRWDTSIHTYNDSSSMSIIKCQEKQNPINENIDDQSENNLQNYIIVFIIFIVSILIIYIMKTKKLKKKFFKK